MVIWDIFTHDVSFYCRQVQRHHNMYAELNSTCAEVISIKETKGRIYFCNLGVTIDEYKTLTIAFNSVIVLTNSKQKGFDEE